MKIKSKLFKEFIKKASLDGSIMTINLEFKEDGLYSSVTTYGNVGITYTSLKKEAFEEYKTHGEMFIRNTKNFLTYISTFDDVISLDVLDEYILKIHDAKREGHIILGSEKVCENIMKDEIKDIPTTVTTEITKNDMTKTIKDMVILGIGNVLIEQKDGILSFTVGEKNESEFFINKIVNNVDGEAKTTIGPTTQDIYNVLGNKIKISLGTDLPVIFEEETEHMKFKCVLAPIIEKNGD